MKSKNEKQKLTKAQTKAAKPRFQIEKLEERIAPSKGGVHGKPGGDRPGCNDHHYSYRRCGR
jgi:hypothetical protein